MTTEIRKGYYIKVTNKGDPKTTVTDTVTGTDTRYIDSEHFSFNRDTWDFEILERPYTLPTEPGVYVMGPSVVDAYIHLHRIAKLNLDGKWTDLSGEATGHQSFVDEMTRFKMPLTRLTIDPSAQGGNA